MIGGQSSGMFGIFWRCTRISNGGLGNYLESLTFKLQYQSSTFVLKAEEICEFCGSSKIIKLFAHLSSATFFK